MNLFLFFFAELFFHQADARGQCFFDGLARGDVFCVVSPGNRCISDGKSLLSYSPTTCASFIFDLCSGDCNTRPTWASITVDWPARLFLNTIFRYNICNNYLSAQLDFVLFSCLLHGAKILNLLKHLYYNPEVLYTGYMPVFQAYCSCLNRYQFGNDL